MDEIMEINSCIEEMAKLKAKMEELEKQKNLNEIIKKTTMEPNLKVLENWLIDYKNALQIKEQKEFKGNVRVRNKRSEQVLLNNIIRQINEKKQEICRKIYSELKKYVFDESFS